MITTHHRHHRDAADAFHSATAEVDQFAGEVRAALKAAAGIVVPGTITTVALAQAIADAERALHRAADEAHADRCQFLCRVIHSMLAIERTKLRRTPIEWLNRHYGPPEPPTKQPRRRYEQDEA